MTKKTCSKCKVEKLVSEFPICRSKKDGYYPSCKQCKNEARAKNPQKARDAINAWRENNREYIREMDRKRYKEHREERLAYWANWAKENKEYWNAYNRSRKEINRPLGRARRAKRRAAQLQRTPAWSEQLEIKRFYANCPEGYEVDHIEPLQGEDVSGLHVIANLQYLLMEENRSKSNKRVA